jgi:hypothetical protein
MDVVDVSDFVDLIDLNDFMAFLVFLLPLSCREVNQLYLWYNPDRNHEHDPRSKSSSYGSLH